MRYILLACLCLQFACKENNKFRSGGDQKAVEATEESNGTGTPAGAPGPQDEEGTTNTALDACINVTTIFTNTKIAKDVEMGKVQVDFTVECMEATDSEVTGEFRVFSKDFQNPTYKSGEKKDNAKGGGKVDYLFHVYFDYKWVPEVTKYTGQEFHLIFTRKDGSKWSRSIRYSITSYDPSKADQDPKNPKQTFNGVDGHPGAKP